jgi:hypothetical protein
MSAFLAYANLTGHRLPTYGGTVAVSCPTAKPLIKREAMSIARLIEPACRAPPMSVPTPPAMSTVLRPNLFPIQMLHHVVSRTGLHGFLTESLTLPNIQRMHQGRRRRGLHRGELHFPVHRWRESVFGNYRRGVRPRTAMFLLEAYSGDWVKASKQSKSA